MHATKCELSKIVRKCKNPLISKAISRLMTVQFFATIWSTYCKQRCEKIKIRADKYWRNLELIISRAKAKAIRELLITLPCYQLSLSNSEKQLFLCFILLFHTLFLWRVYLLCWLILYFLRFFPCGSSGEWVLAWNYWIEYYTNTANIVIGIEYSNKQRPEMDLFDEISIEIWIYWWLKH